MILESPVIEINKAILPISSLSKDHAIIGIDMKLSELDKSEPTVNQPILFIFIKFC